MANSIARYFKGIWYALIGRAQRRFDRRTHNLKAMRAAYEVLIRVKQEDVQRYKNVMGQSIALIEQKKDTLRGVMNDIEKLEQMKAGAITKSKNTAAELRDSGASAEEIKQHPDYVQHITSYNDYHSTLEEKNARVAKLEQDIERAQEDIETHKLQMTGLHRDLDKLKTQQSDAVADMIAAQEQIEINDMLSGISKNDISMELLQKIQEEIRQEEGEDVNEESETDGDKKSK